MWLSKKKCYIDVMWISKNQSNVGIGCAWNTANVQAGSSVAIFGLGAVGLAVSFSFSDSILAIS